MHLLFFVKIGEAVEIQVDHRKLMQALDAARN